MSATEIDRRGLVSATVKRDDELIARAALRTRLAGVALTGAAADLNDAHGHDGNALMGVTDVVLDHAARVSRLAEDIESRRPRAEQGLELRQRIGRGERSAPCRR